MEISENYGPYRLVSRQKKVTSGKFAVGVRIYRKMDQKELSCQFDAEDNIHYILEVEAAKEGINLGRNLIDRGLVDF